MKYGLQFTIAEDQTWFNVWFKTEEERDRAYSNLRRSDWKQGTSAFNLGAMLVNLNYILTVKKIEEAEPTLEPRKSGEE